MRLQTSKDMLEKMKVKLLNAGFEAALVTEMLQVGRLKNFDAERVVMSPGTKADEIPMVISGLLSVMRYDDQGNHLFLYYLESGETCAMSLACCFEGMPSPFYVIAEQNASLWMIPSVYLDGWIQKYHSFRQFVFQSYQARFDELLNAIDSIAFLKMDDRLYKYLLDLKQATGTYVINKTHQQIANDLNTSRVVISRLLKQMEKEERIEQKRNRIEIL